MISHVSPFVVLLILAFPRQRHLRSLKGGPRDATLVSLIVLLGACALLLVGQVLFDVMRP